MPKPSIQARVLVATATVVLLIASPSCKGKLGDICQRKIECEGGNDADIDACEQEASGAEGVASAYDCSDAFDRFVECEHGSGACITDKDKRKFSSGDACKGLDDTLEACQKSASARR